MAKRHNHGKSNSMHHECICFKEEDDLDKSNLNHGCNDTQPSHIMPSIGGFILGSSDFVSWVKDTLLSNRDDENEIPQLRRLKPRVTLDAIVQNICGTFGGSEKQIPEKGRKDKKSRDIAIYFARDLSGVGCKEVGNFLGEISGTAITVRYNHVAREIKGHTKLNRQAKKIKKHIRND